MAVAPLEDKDIANDGHKEHQGFVHNLTGYHATTSFGRLHIEQTSAETPTSFNTHVHHSSEDMSSSPASRGSARSTSQRPSTPDQTRPPISRTGSGSFAPKSEYLRNALQARRAQNTPTPSPLDMRVPLPPATKPQEVKSERTSPDLFAEFALSEEQTAPVSPIRRRRPSEAGPPRSKTSRELTKEIETLKDSLMTSNMRVELLKKRSTELQHDNTELKERLEELEPLEEENHELRNENSHYKLKIQDMDEDMERLKEENDTLRESNEEMLAINVECSSHWEDQELAVREAADTIIALETGKAALAAEVQELKKRVTALEDSNLSTTDTLVDGSPRCPSIIYSIDEARPSTSHFDSDYYSQPDSPENKTSRESFVSITPSERSKKFLDLTQERRRSARDLAKRMSVASLKALKIASPSPAPAVPEVPVAYQQQLPRIVEVVANDRRPSRTPKRYHDCTFPQQPLLDALEMSPTLDSDPGVSNSRSPTKQAYDSPLVYRPGRSVSKQASLDTDNLQTPTWTVRSKSRQHSVTEISPRVPSRMSSKQAHINSSSETLSTRDYPSSRDLRNPQPRGQSELDIGVKNVHEECPPPLPSRSSLASDGDLTSEADPSDKDRWWRSIDRLNPPVATTTTVQPQIQQPRPVIGFYTVLPSQAQASRRTSIKSHTQTDRHVTPTRHPGTGSSAVRSSSRSTVSPATTPYGERDFLFNGNEDDDAFLRKVKGGRR